MDAVVLREGRPTPISIARLDTPPRLLPTHLPAVPAEERGTARRPRPQFLVIGGMVLTRCSLTYLKDAFGPSWPRLAPVKLLDKLTEYPRF